MSEVRDVAVYLLPELAPAEGFAGQTAVVIDVLRTTTSMVHALAAGCRDIRPVLDIDEARATAARMQPGTTLLAGERAGVQIAGFDLGNSPRKFNARTCRGLTVIMTTSNGTRALLRCTSAARTLVAAFANYSAVCEQLRHDRRPISIVCSGTDGDVTLEDTLLAGALVDFLCEPELAKLNDGARLAWDCFETHGRCLQGALELSRGGQWLEQLGFHDDITACAKVDEFALVPELKSDPLRVEVGAVGIAKSYWSK